MPAETLALCGNMQLVFDSCRDIPKSVEYH